MYRTVNNSCPYRDQGSDPRDTGDDGSGGGLLVFGKRDCSAGARIGDRREAASHLT